MENKVLNPSDGFKIIFQQKFNQKDTYTTEMLNFTIKGMLT